MFRFIIDDGTTKYIKSVGSFTKQYDEIKTGVMYDMTDQ
jgi:hypothetical protein